MHKPRLSALLTCGLLALLLSASNARADELYGRIRGTVTDQSGGVVPSAKVTVTNTATGISRNMTTSSSGDFEFVNLLAPGLYNVDVVKAGFRKFEQTNIHLDVNQVYVVSAILEVGSTTQTVTVEANVAQINTTQMQLGVTVTGNTITEMPLVNRTFVELQQLQPGVVGVSDRMSAGGGYNYSTNGAESQQNSFLVNGVDTADFSMNILGISPSPDAIGEFKMVTSTINPEFGRNSGAILNAVIKNGTNQIHGDGFEFYRDTFMLARNFFQPSTAPFHQNEFGGTVGGPILFPHLYNGKNKSFFFFSYQGIRNVFPLAFSVPTVYSSAQRGGAFSDLATSTGSSAFPMVGDDGTTYPAGTAYSTIFSQGTIPQADLNPLALKLMNQYVPQANAAGSEYEFSPTETSLDDQYITRIDQNFGAKDSLWGYWYWERNPSTASLPFAGADLPGFAEVNFLHNQQYALSWTHTFTPTTLNEARFGYFRINFNAVNPQTQVNPTTYGFTGITTQNPASASIPVMFVVGYFNLGFTLDGPQPRIENTYQAIDNFTKIVGRHTLKAGVTMERYEMYNPFWYAVNGYYVYAGAGTFTTGDPGADFLLGLPDDYAQSNGGVTASRAREYYSYAQDEFKLRPNLTMTYGIGWDVETPYLNLYYGGRDVTAFRPGQQSTVFPTAPPGVLWPGDTGINTAGGISTPYHNFAPRLGFAWSPGTSHKWSLHAGAGIYYNRTEEEIALQNVLTIPFSITSLGAGNIGGSPSFAAPFSGWCPPSVTGLATPTACSTPNPFPYTPPAPGSKSVNFAPLEPLGFNTLSPNFGVPSSYNYNIMVERQLGASTTMSVAYVGNVGRHLEGDFEVNPAGTASGLNPVAAAAGCTAANLGYCAPQTFRYNPVTTGLGGIWQQGTAFNSRYNSLQVSVNKRMSHGLSFLAAYTWSRFFDQNSSADLQDGLTPPGIDPFNFANMWAPSNNDAPQRFVFSYDYTLPFYHFVPHVRRLTDGWKLVGATTFQSGFPITVADSANPSLTCYSSIETNDVPCWDRPNRVSGVSLAHGNPRTYTINGNSNYWFNPAAFSMAAPGTGIGNSSRNPLYGPGFNNFDIALYKEIHITENKLIQLRLETYNTFNHTQFMPSAYSPEQLYGGTVSDINDPRFGRVISANAGRIVQLSGKIYF